MTNHAHIGRLTLQLAREVLVRDRLEALLEAAQAVVAARRLDLRTATARIRIDGPSLSSWTAQGRSGRGNAQVVTPAARMVQERSRPPRRLQPKGAV